MSKILKHFALIGVFVLIISTFPAGSAGLDSAAKRALTHAEYDAWRSIYRPALSADGNWILYIDTPQDGEAELVVLNAKNKKEFRYSVGYSGEGTTAQRSVQATFSPDISTVVFLISPSQEEVKAAKKSNEKNKDEPPKKLGIMNLSSGNVTVVDKVKSFKLPEDKGDWVVYLRDIEPKLEEEEEGEEKKEKEKPEKPEEKAEDKREYGTPLVLRSLKNGEETEFNDVLEYLYSKNGEFIFFSVSCRLQPETDGIYVVLTGKGQAQPLLLGKGRYSKLSLDKSQSRLAFITDRDDQESKEPVFSLYGWENGMEQASCWVSQAVTSGFPQGMSVSDKADVSFSETGSVVIFGIKEIPEPEPEEDMEAENDEAKFELWHWNDPFPQPQQKVMASRIKDNAWESVYFLNSKKFVKLADKEVPDVELSDNAKVAFAQSNWPYTKRVAYDGSYYDVYVIDPETGEKTLVRQRLYGRARLSPNAKYVYWFAQGDWYIYDISTKRTRNITEKFENIFEQHDFDRPEPISSYGAAGWTDDDTSFLVYDRFDIWELNPDGSSARNVTEGLGRESFISLRYLRLDPDEKTIDPNKELLLKAIDQNTMAEGFFSDKVKGADKPVKLMQVDRTIRPFIKAKKTDKYLYASSTFEEYPDLWYSGKDLHAAQKITDMGRQMEPFLWGKSELRDFFSADGKPLKGILIKPENFDPGKKYPLMVFIYETLHQGRHRYRHPAPGSSINPSYYVSNGYIIWQPDIEYDTGYPGRDALKCVLPGIQMLIREGYIDSDAIGIQGHSWGGYQIAYMVTQTNIFSAAVCGAPVSNMTSAYGGIRWASGMVRQFQYERTQSRLGDTLWQVPLRYIENSPLFWVDKIQTPVMYMHNDEDGAVPWYQGIEFIMALRRLEKEAYMFNYNGEAHGLRKRVNQKDYTIRQAEFFDHHLKGAPLPDWMEFGIKAWEKNK